MVRNMKVIGETMLLMEKVSFTTSMEMSMKVIGKTIRQMARVLMFMLTVQSTSEIGKMTSNTERERRHGRMEVSTMDTMLIQRNKAKVFTSGLMETHT